MFQRFAREAREIVVTAGAEARRLGHDYIGTEHLLVALAGQPDCVGATVLRRHGLSLERGRELLLDIVGPGRLDRPDPEALRSIGIDLDAVREKVESAFGPGALERIPRGRRPFGHLAFTPRAKKALEGALTEARGLEHHHIGSEHVLLGLLRVNDSVATEMLERAGSGPHQVRRELLELLARSA